MPQLLVISDANVLIDKEAGGLLRPMFRLDYHFAVPDVLYEVELRQDHTNLLKLGLRRMELSGNSVRYVETLAADIRARGVSRYDLFALALARQEDCLLLTGDSRMRKLAKAEGRAVRMMRCAPQIDGCRGKTSSGRSNPLRCRYSRLTRPWL